jgi:hypothetical protein
MSFSSFLSCVLGRGKSHGGAHIDARVHANVHANIDAKFHVNVEGHSALASCADLWLTAASKPDANDSRAHPLGSGRTRSRPVRRGKRVAFSEFNQGVRA